MDGDDPLATRDRVELADKVVKAAKRGKNLNQISSSLAQLRLSHMRLHGREGDLNLLKSKLRELKSVDNANYTKKTAAPSLPEIVLVSGVSGTGKSALVMRGLRDPAEKMGVVFAGGKFDLNNTALPLSAFVDAMASLSDFVLGGNKSQQIKEEIRTEFGEEDALVLSRAMPGSGRLFSTTKAEASGRYSAGAGKEANNKTSVTGKGAVSRLQYSIRRLLKIVCTHLNGVVLFIDDLQWSDAATLELIESISLDVEIPSLLIVGAYREDEVSDFHPLALQIREKEQMGIEITKISIGNLSPDDVLSLIAESLGMEGDEDRVEVLAATVHKKTEGNAFFVLVFLRSLYDEGLLQYNFGALKWMWDDNVVKARLATENVATILVNKLKCHHRGTQNILKVASCLGSKFSTSTMAVVTETLSPLAIQTLSSAVETEPFSDDEDDTISSLGGSIHELEEEGLFEKESKKRLVWQFSHDKIQAAAFELISADKRDSFRGEIGNILMKGLNPGELERSLFEVVSLRNYAIATVSDDERRELAKMNLRAGIKASEKAAFDTAAVYFKVGRALLGPNGWEKDPDTMMKLCSEGANACFICSDLVSMDVLINEVLGRDISVGDKFKVYETKILAAQAASKFGDCISLALEVRKQLGLPNPKNKPASTLTVLKEYIKTTRALGKRTAEDILNLPALTNERILMGQRMLELMLPSTYQAAPTMFPLVAFLLVRTSLKHGINVSSCDAFANFGILLCGHFGNPQRGRKMAEVVDLLLDKPGMSRMKSRQALQIQSFIAHWTAPLQGTLAPLLEGYQIGLETGDVESAGFNLTFRSWYLYFAGRPLEGLLHELQTNVYALVQMKQKNSRDLLLPYVLTVKKLRGVEIEDDELSFEVIVKSAAGTGNQLLRSVTIVAQLSLLVILSDWEAAKSLLVEAGNLRPFVPGFFQVPYFTFLEGLICLKQARCEKAWSTKRIWKKRGTKSMNLLRGWAKKGNVNVVHYVHLLKAELAILEGSNTPSAEESYKSAISVAGRSGLLQDKALAHELASSYFAVKSDSYWKDYHTKNAKECYSDWGALAKVEQLNR